MHNACVNVGLVCTDLQVNDHCDGAVSLHSFQIPQYLNCSSGVAIKANTQ